MIDLMNGECFYIALLHLLLGICLLLHLTEFIAFSTDPEKSWNINLSFSENHSRI